MLYQIELNSLLKYPIPLLCFRVAPVLNSSLNVDFRRQMSLAGVPLPVSHYKLAEVRFFTSSISSYKQMQWRPLAWSVGSFKLQSNHNVGHTVTGTGHETNWEKKSKTNFLKFPFAHT